MIWVPVNSHHIYIVNGSNWIYADHFDIGSYETTVDVCVHGQNGQCYGNAKTLGSVRFVVEANSKRLFPHGSNYYFDSRAAYVDDIALATGVSNSIPFFDNYYSQLYVS